MTIRRLHLISWTWVDFPTKSIIIKNKLTRMNCLHFEESFPHWSNPGYKSSKKYSPFVESKCLRYPSVQHALSLNDKQALCVNSVDIGDGDA